VLPARRLVQRHHVLRRYRRPSRRAAGQARHGGASLLLERGDSAWHLPCEPVPRRAQGFAGLTASVGESLRRLGSKELAPAACADRVCDHFAGCGRYELDAAGALLPILRLILIFGGLMRELLLCEQVLRNRVG